MVLARQTLVQERIADGAEKGYVNHPASVHVPHFRVSEAEFPTSKTMWMNRYLRPRGDFVFEVLQTVHHPSIH
jgi:hypothetical protein